MQTDADFLGLVPGTDQGRSHFTVVDRLSRLDGRLYGGTAIAVSIAAAEAVSRRSALWMTTQFVSSADQGDRVEVLAEVLADGRRTNQVRVTGTRADGEVVFASLGATGHRRVDGLTGEFERRPTVTGPDESETWTTPFAGLAAAAGLTSVPEPPTTTGFGLAVEMRSPEVADHPDPGPGRVCLWVRRRDGVPVTPALAAYLADMVPMSVAHALGTVAIGTSLDNTIRVGSFVESGWILLDLRPHLATGGYAHGIAHVWSEDGHLLATASQTASMVQIDLAALPWVGRTS